MADVQLYIDREMSRFQAELFDFLRIPSVSARSEHSPDIHDAASWVGDRLRDAGLEASVMETPGHPVVLGEWRGAGPDAQTLLIYGHYAVQPPEPLEEWHSPAFEPTVRDGNLFARGASDDKGQLFLHIKALESQLKGAGSLPVNVVVVAEGEEEIGSLVRSALGELSTQDQRLLHLRYEEGLTLGRISDALQITIEQVKYRLKRAASGMRRELLARMAREEAFE